MFLVDDILLFPVRSLLWVFKEIHNAAQQESEAEPEQITAALRELYMSLETGRISEEEFSAQEKILLDRLDRIREEGGIIEAKPTEEDHP